MLASTVDAVTASIRSGRLAPRPWVTQVNVLPCWAAAATANVRPSELLIMSQSSNWQAPPAAAAGATLTGLGAGAARLALADRSVHAPVPRSATAKTSATKRRNPGLRGREHTMTAHRKP